MSKPRGRPLQPRTDTERLDYLVQLLDFGRNRGEIGIEYEGANVVLYAGVKDLGDGVDLRTAIDRAISMHPQRRAKA